MDTIEKIEAEQQELFDRRTFLTAKVQGLQVDIGPLNFTLRTTQRHRDYLVLTKERDAIVRARMDANAGLSEVRGALRDLALRQKIVERRDKAGERARDMMSGNGDNEILPGQMSPIDLVVLAFREFGKLDRKKALDGRQRSIMKKMEPYAQDRAERQKRLERQQRGM